ncbi:Inward rectifier potassium channel superfamily [Synechococcus sp. PCC 7335]|uniref:ion channel n=1 Tax=Synechococcus sp. (strain ATCC 29403 / PCC 7335) TaxID=91464 RepID=UPI00017EE758|nr:ion channel [Synechococcus sp. PCC 7335]EDX87029.1 Inward rectifier potassium channel superfamily [Synechococcus sp. PCC 7335]
MRIDIPWPRRLPKVRIHIQNGRFRVLGLGGWYSYWRDPYYLMLTIPWPGFALITVGVYVIANAVAALLFLLGGEGAIVNARPGSFIDAFFFSVQTSASIGYGVMSPGNTYAHVLVTLEAVVSLVGIAVLTGLAYARFSRPTAMVMFSKVAVISNFAGAPTLMFRAANERRNQILEAQMRLYLAMDENFEGRMMRRFYELELHRDRNPSFFLTWTALHSVDTHSPLFGLDQPALFEKNIALIVSLSGIDQTVAQAIHTRHTYYATDLLWNYEFKDIIHAAPHNNEDPDATIRYIDFSDFHEVEKAPKHKD